MMLPCSDFWIMTTAISCLLLPSSARFKKEPTDPGGTFNTDDPVWKIRHVLPAPDLEDNTVTDVKVNSGDVAYLPCRFRNLSTFHEVSWVRLWDWNILTTGIYTYTRDMRVNVLHTVGSDDWTLQLQHVTIRDNGTYLCQMSTGTGVVSKYVNLHVSRSKATIDGPEELHVQEGAIVILVCTIQQSKPPFVFWYHGEDMVNNDSQRHHMDVATTVEGSRTQSILTINDIRYNDSGNYSCIPPHVESASVMLYVTRGDTAEAVHRRGHSSAASLGLSSLATSVWLFLLFLGTTFFGIIFPR